MALFRLPLLFNKNISFYKLMGSGKNGGFTVKPDLQQWAIMVTLKEEVYFPGNYNYIRTAYGAFIIQWWRFFNTKHWTIVMEAIEGHGKWDGKEAFGTLPRISDYNGRLAVLTRATIRMSKAGDFWKNVDAVAREMAATPGFKYSIGIGEVPWIKQATFSIWQDKESMKQFAYTMQHHRQVVGRTRQEKWYSEDMFVRFKIVDAFGDLPAALSELI